MQRSDEYRIKYTLTNNCNFDCNYCVLHGNEDSHVSIQELKNSLAMIDKEFADEFKKIYVCLTGGETTLYSKFNEFTKYIVSYFPDKQLKLKVTTNGTRIDKLYKLIDDIKEINRKNFTFEVFFSFHFHQDKDYKKFSEMVIKFKEYSNKIINTEISIFCMLENNPNITKAIDYFSTNIFKKSKINLEYLEIAGIVDYYEKFDSRKYIRKIYNTTNSMDLIGQMIIDESVATCTPLPGSFKNYKCNGIVDSIHIRYNGDMFPNDNCPLSDPIGNCIDIQTIESLKIYKKIGFYLCKYEYCNNCTHNNFKEKF